MFNSFQNHDSTDLMAELKCTMWIPKNLQGDSVFDMQSLSHQAGDQQTFESKDLEDVENCSSSIIQRREITLNKVMIIFITIFFKKMKHYLIMFALFSST